MPAHKHQIFTAAGALYDPGALGPALDGGTGFSASTGGGGSHTHTFNGDAFPTHTHDSTNNFPLFFKLAFIVFVGP